jgi:hypothetical protein
MLRGRYIDGSPASLRWSGGLLSSSFTAERALLLGSSAGGVESALNVTAGKCCPGDSLFQFKGITNTSACNALCAKYASQGCKAFTMNYGEDTCYLKSRARCANTGHCDCGHPGLLPGACAPHKPAPPPPAHNKSKILLYRLRGIGIAAGILDQLRVAYIFGDGRASLMMRWWWWWARYNVESDTEESAEMSAVWRPLRPFRLPF